LERAKNFFGFEEFARNFAGSQRVPGVIGVDLFYGFGDLAAEILDRIYRINWMRKIWCRFACIVSG
jgi:hypothetical protein